MVLYPEVYSETKDMSASENSSKDQEVPRTVDTKIGDRPASEESTQVMSEQAQDKMPDQAEATQQIGRARADTFFMSVPPNSPHAGPISETSTLDEQVNKLCLNEIRKAQYTDRIISAWGSDTCLVIGCRPSKYAVCARCKQDIRESLDPQPQLSNEGKPAEDLSSRDCNDDRKSNAIVSRIQEDLDFWSDDDGLMDDIDEAQDAAKREADREKASTGQIRERAEHYRKMNREILAGRIERQQRHIEKLRLQGNVPELTLDHATMQAFLTRGSTGLAAHDGLGLRGLSFLSRPSIWSSETASKAAIEGLLESQERHISEARLRKHSDVQSAGVSEAQQQPGPAKLPRMDSFDEAVASIADISSAGSVMQADVANEYDEDDEVLRAREGHL